MLPRKHMVAKPDLQLSLFPLCWRVSDSLLNCPQLINFQPKRFPRSLSQSWQPEHAQPHAGHGQLPASSYWQGGRYQFQKDAKNTCFCLFVLQTFNIKKLSIWRKTFKLIRLHVSWPAKFNKWDFRVFHVSRRAQRNHFPVTYINFRAVTASLPVDFTPALHQC